MPLVYQATNIVNGKTYIGVTRTSLERRKYMHVWLAHNRKKNGDPVFAKAIRKYGASSFIFEVVKEFETIEEAMDFERLTIDQLRPAYNMCAGGYGPTHHKWSDVQRERVRESMRLTWTPEKRAIHGLSRKGVKRSPETIAAIVAARKGKDYGRPVMCLDDGAIYPSARKAAKFYGLKENGVSSVCHGRWQRVRGMHFMFFDRPVPDSERVSIIAGLADKTKLNKAVPSVSRQRAVVLLPCGKKFISAASAAREMSIVPSRVMQLCQTGGRTRKGFGFSYADQYKEAR